MGQGITLAIKHKDKARPQGLEGHEGSPFRSTIRCTIICCAIISPSMASIPTPMCKLRSVPPPEMVANLRAEKHRRLSSRPTISARRAIFDGRRLHAPSVQGKSGTGIPAAASRRAGSFITDIAQQFLRRLTRGHCRRHRLCLEKPKNRKQIAEAIAPANYINAPVTGCWSRFSPGPMPTDLAASKTDAKRVDFDPFPWQSFAVWMLTQMKRWGQIKGDVDYKAVAEQVYLATDTRKVMTEMGLAAAADVVQIVLGDGARPSIGLHRTITSTASRSGRRRD